MHNIDSELNYFLDLVSSREHLWSCTFNGWNSHNRSMIEFLYKAARRGVKCSISLSKPYSRLDLRFPFGEINSKEIREEIQTLGIILIDPIIQNDHLLAPLTRSSFDSILNDIGDPVVFEQDGFLIGPSLMSSLTIEFGVTSFRTGLLKPLLYRRYRRFVDTVNSTSLMVNRFGIDSILVFNGRFTDESAVAQVAKRMECEILFHEHDSSENFYYLSTKGFHSPSHHYADFLRRSSHLDASQLYSLGDTWYKERIDQDIVQSSLSHQQMDNRFQDNVLKSSRYKVVIFPTSDDEYVGLDIDWKHVDGLSQIELIKRISQALVERGFEVTIRLHPNLSVRSHKMTKVWLKLSQDLNISLIEPQSKTNSYKLAVDADLVVTVGSTMGIESAYLNRPVVNFGSSFYNFFNAVHHCNSLQEFLDIDLHNFMTVQNLRKDGIFEYGANELLRRISYELPKSLIFPNRASKDINFFSNLLRRLYIWIIRILVAK